MEQENQNINHSVTADGDTVSTDAVSTDTVATDTVPTDTARTDEQDFQQLLAASPTLSPLAGWLKCLRKPAISVEYSLRKRHVPDLDEDDPKSEENGSNPTNSRDKTCGRNSDVMGVQGSFTIRYFDFALGILGLAIVSCMTKGCQRLKRKMG